MGLNKSKSKLSDVDLTFLTKHTNLDADTVKERFGVFRRACPSGQLTPKQFCEAYKMFCPTEDVEKFCNHVFRTFDLDHNGYIDFVEFELAINITSSGSPEEKLKWAFRLYDEDGDGSIDQYELVEVYKSIFEMSQMGSSKLGPNDARLRAKNMFIKLDMDGNCRLSEEEFVRGCLKDDVLRDMLAPTNLFTNQMPNSVQHRNA